MRMTSPPALDLDMKIVSVHGFALSSPYGNGNSLGQPNGLKSTGFLEVRVESGHIGWGETYTGVYAPELVAPLADYLAPLLIGKKLGDQSLIEELSQIPFIGRSGALRSVLSGVELAIWDCRGKVLEKPVSALLTIAPRSQVRVYASGGSAALEAQEVFNDAIEQLSRGFLAYKMRVGFQAWESDLERVGFAREAVGGLPLMVDAIMGTLRPGWDYETALSRARELEKFKLAWLEEPISPDQVSEQAKIREQVGVPIASGEAYSGKLEIGSLLSLGAVDILQVDATHSGGVSECLSWISKAADEKKGSSLHVWGSPIALAANASVAASTPHETILEVPTVSLEIAEEMWIEKPKIRNGLLELSDEPGFGIHISESMKLDYRLVPGSGYRLPSLHQSRGSDQ